MCIADPLRVVFLGLLTVIAAMLAMCLLAGNSSAEEDRYYFFGEPLANDTVVYSGDIIQFSVQFENNWSNWSVEFHSWLFSTYEPASPRWPPVQGGSFRWNEPVWTRATEGIYEVNMTVNRSADGVAFERIETTFTMDYRYALNVTDFYIRNDNTGLFVVLELDLHIPLDRLEVDLHAEGGNFEVVPDVVVLEDLPSGSHEVVGEIVIDRVRNGPPQIIMFDLVANSSAHVILMDGIVEDPEFRGETGWGALLWLVPVILVAVLIISVHLISKRLKGKESLEEDNKRA